MAPPILDWLVMMGSESNASLLRVTWRIRRVGRNYAIDREVLLLLRNLTIYSCECIKKQKKDVSRDVWFFVCLYFIKIYRCVILTTSEKFVTRVWIIWEHSWTLPFYQYSSTQKWNKYLFLMWSHPLCARGRWEIVTRSMCAYG